jgi:hypothetical protein
MTCPLHGELRLRDYESVIRVKVELGKETNDLSRCPSPSQLASLIHYLQEHAVA